MKFALSKKIRYSVTVLLCLLLIPASLSAQIPDRVILGGNTAGIKLYTGGPVVVGFSEIPSYGKYFSPGKVSGLRKGDVILAADGISVTNGEGLEEYIQKTDGKRVVLTLSRNGEKLEKEITPVYYNDACLYKIGVWVKESAAGIGTITFINPETKVFAALGHGISDSATGMLLPLKNGSITDCTLSSVSKSEQGSPGELKGVFSGDDTGFLLKNTDKGVYGVLSSLPEGAETFPVASREQVKTGEAIIYSDAAGGDVLPYKARICRILKYNTLNSKELIIEITDPRLLEITGGIVQGMSGSPIVQNGKLVGAVTHVFVNDPTRGYGIFFENMLSEAEEIK